MMLSMEKAMAPHSSTLAWKIPWMEESGRRQSMGSLRVRHPHTTTLINPCFISHLPILSCRGPKLSVYAYYILIRSYIIQGTSLAVQWLGLHSTNAWAVNLIPGWGTKSLHAIQHGQKINKLKNKTKAWGIHWDKTTI